MAREKTLHFTIVEDAPLHRRMLRSQIKRVFPDALITEATNVAEALQALQLPMDLAIVDVHLGTENAAQLLTAFPKETRKFPVLMVTGDRSEQTLSAMFDAGVDDYLTKPLDSIVFEGKIRNLLEGDYLSPLNFFGLQEKLEPAEIGFSLSLCEVTENLVVFESALAISKGAQLVVEMGEVRVPVKITEAEKVSGTEIYVCEGVPLLETMDDDQRTGFRRAILGLAGN